MQKIHCLCFTQGNCYSMLKILMPTDLVINRLCGINCVVLSQLERFKILLIMAFTLTDTDSTEMVMDIMILCRCIHTAPTLIFIGHCTHFICLNLCVGLGQCKCTVRLKLKA